MNYTMKLKSLSTYPTDTVGKFLGVLMVARNVVHIKHLQSQSFSEHKALEDLYSALPDHIDALAENYQGRTNTIIDDYNLTCADFSKKSALDYVKTIRTYIDDNRKVFGTYSEIQNQLDELVSTLNSTVYKLTNLK